MHYLNVDQALADLAYFIEHIKETRSEYEGASVFVVGGSYSATMAAWMRQKYPHLVAGAWASSAPLHAKVNFVEYKEVMGRSIELLGGKECLERFRSAYSEMETMVRRGDVERLNTELDLCTPLDVNDQMNVWSLFGELSDDVAGLVQTHRGQNIQNACTFILDTQYKDAFAAYAAWTRSRNRGCFEYDYQETVEFLTQVEWNAPANGAGKLFLHSTTFFNKKFTARQWIYQTCSEFGWYQTSDSDDQPFGSSFPVELYYEYCKDFYGSQYSRSRVDANVRRINLLYGSFKPTASNVYYSHGQVDPWSAMGVDEDVSSSAPVTVIPLVAHCADMGSINANDGPEMLESKQRVVKLAGEWLGFSDLPSL